MATDKGMLIITDMHMAMAMVAKELLIMKKIEQ